MILQFVFDYRSPYAYLASTRLPSLDVPIDYRPVDVLAVMRAVNNQPSPACPPKARYSRTDAGRWARLYGVPLAPNAALMAAMKTGDFDGTLLTRAGLAALELGVFEAAHDALFAAVWAGNDDLLSASGRGDFLARNGIDADIWHHTESPAIHERLALNNEHAVSHGVFGVPSFLVGDELFFGNDRLDFVRAALQSTTREGAHP